MSDEIFELFVSEKPSRADAMDYIGTAASLTEQVCISCRNRMNLIFLVTLADCRLSLERCATCAPMTLDYDGTEMLRVHRGSGFASCEGLVAMSRRTLDVDRDDEFTSKIGGRSLLMDESAAIPWPDGGDDERARRHVLSLVDSPKVGFDPTRYPLVVFADEDDPENFTWVGDGR